MKKAKKEGIQSAGKGVQVIPNSNVQNSEVKLESAPESTEDSKPEKPKFKNIPLKDYGTWITRPMKKGDLDINGKQVSSKRVFCLKQEDIEDADLPAYGLIYDKDAKDSAGNPMLVAYKKPQIRNSARGAAIKDEDGKKEIHNQYKQHTVMIEQPVEGNDIGIGLAGYWKSALTPEDIAEMEKIENENEKAAKEKIREKEEKAKEREEKAKAKAEEIQAKATEKAVKATATEGEGTNQETEKTVPRKTKKKIAIEI